MNTDKERWEVRHVHYMTCAEVDILGDKKPTVVLRNLTLKEALAAVERMGFGYSAHQQQEQR